MVLLVRQPLCESIFYMKNYIDTQGEDRLTVKVYATTRSKAVVLM